MIASTMPFVSSSMMVAMRSPLFVVISLHPLTMPTIVTSSVSTSFMLPCHAGDPPNLGRQRGRGCWLK